MALWWHQYHRNALRSAAGICLVVCGVSAFVLAAFNLHEQPLPSIPLSGVAPPSAPSSVHPSEKAIANYQVAPDQPKYIAIPALHISRTRIIQLGLLQSGQIGVPDNIYDVGWYNGSAKPGAAGAMFIYGHVSSWTANGVFYSLKSIRPGDDITITRGDNKIFTYRVVSSKVYPYNAVDMATVLSPIDSSASGLNLMTCTGTVLKGTSEFSERLVVFTRQLTT